MKRYFLILALVYGVTFGAQASSGAVITVPNNYSSIGEALSNCESGDQIHIEQGLYYEFNLIVPSGVSLTGMGDYPEQVVINAKGLGRIMVCEDLDDSTIIQNITFTNGFAAGSLQSDRSGGAILIKNSNLQLINCRFTSNSAEGHGGALRCTHSSPQIINCTFESNTAPDGGGGAIDCSFESNLQLNDCFFQHNKANWGGAISFRGESSPLVNNSIFTRNEAAGNLGYGGAALADFGAEPLFFSCTFFSNGARYGGALACFEGSKTNLRNCTMVENSSQWMGAGMICSKAYPVIENSIIAFQDGSSIACGDGALPMISCTNIFGNDQGDWTGVIEAQLQAFNNMSIDPMFCDQNPEFEYMFHLQTDSPCADENSGCSVMGAWAAGCDITPIYIDGFTATWSDGVPLIRWQTNRQKSIDGFVLLRSFESQMNETHPITIQASGDSRFIAYDSDYPTGSGKNLVYRLYHVQEDGSQVLISQTNLADTHIFQPLHLVGARPNPFNPRTTISFETSAERLVSVTVHNIRGQQIKELSHQHYPAGVHELDWTGVDGSGRRMESGTYFIIIRADGMVRSQKIMLLK